MTPNLDSYNLTVDQVAVKLGYTAQRVRALAKDGKLPALKRFRKWMFCEAEIIQNLRQQSPVAITPKSVIKRDNDDNRESILD